MADLTPIFCRLLLKTSARAPIQVETFNLVSHAYTTAVHSAPCTGLCCYCSAFLDPDLRRILITLHTSKLLFVLVASTFFPQ